MWSRFFESFACGARPAVSVEDVTAIPTPSIPSSTMREGSPRSASYRSMRISQSNPASTFSVASDLSYLYLLEV